MTLRVFPVAGRAAFADAFGSHRGTDIFAPTGTPLVAVDDGEARSDTDPKGGLVVYLTARDGVVYYYAHLSAYAGGFPRSIQAGEPLGAVGTTGNAQGKDPHLHFEVHPNGDHTTVDPFPLLAALVSAPAGSVAAATTAPTHPKASGAAALVTFGMAALGGYFFWRRYKRATR